MCTVTTLNGLFVPPMLIIYCRITLESVTSAQILCWAAMSKCSTSWWRSYLIQMVVTLNKTQRIQFLYTHRSAYCDWIRAVLCNWLVHWLLFQYFSVMAKINVCTDIRVFKKPKQLMEKNMKFPLLRSLIFCLTFRYWTNCNCCHEWARRLSSLGARWILKLFFYILYFTRSFALHWHSGRTMSAIPAGSAPGYIGSAAAAVWKSGNACWIHTKGVW